MVELWCGHCGEDEEIAINCESGIYEFVCGTWGYSPLKWCNQTKCKIHGAD